MRVDVSDTHIYGGLLLLVAGAALVHLALGLAVAGAGLIAIGALYATAEAKAAQEAPKAPPSPIGLRTAADVAEE